MRIEIVGLASLQDSLLAATMLVIAALTVLSAVLALLVYRVKG